MRKKQTFKEQGHPKQAELSSLVKHWFKDLEFSIFEKDFIKKAWADEKIKKIAARIEIKNGFLSFDAPYGHNHGRYPDVKYILIQAHRRKKLPDCEFLVLLNDAYASKFPAFSVIRRLEEDVCNIPFPMGNIRGYAEGCGTPLMGWDDYIESTIVASRNNVSWNKKSSIAVFRGQYAYQTWKLGEYTKVKAEKWTEVNRGYLHEVCKNKPDIFDVGFNKIGQNNTEEEIPTVKGIPFVEQQEKYKYMISVGTNANWAERIRTHLFSSSVLVKHEAEAQEWFYTLMKPWKHYIPFDLMMTDLEKNIKWAQKNDRKCQQIVKNANELAKTYLNENTMILFAGMLIEEYAQRSKDLWLGEDPEVFPK